MSTPVVTMFASDREMIRQAGNVIALATRMIDSIDKIYLSPENYKTIKEQIEILERVRLALNRIDSQAVTCQLSPGTTIPL